MLKDLEPRFNSKTDSGLDVTEKRVVEGCIKFDRKPDCVRHGAMNCVEKAPDGDKYRCSECGVGALYFPTNSQQAKRAFSEAWDARVK